MGKTAFGTLWVSRDKTTFMERQQSGQMLQTVNLVELLIYESIKND